MSLFFKPQPGKCGSRFMTDLIAAHVFKRGLEFAQLFQDSIGRIPLCQKLFQFLHPF